MIFNNLVCFHINVIYLLELSVSYRRRTNTSCLHPLCKQSADVTLDMSCPSVNYVCVDMNNMFWLQNDVNLKWWGQKTFL